MRRPCFNCDSQSKSCDITSKMPQVSERDKLLKKYEEDPRVACKYGEKCYQKNEPHLKTYKHPPKIADQEKQGIIHKEKRKEVNEDNNETLSQVKRQKLEVPDSERGNSKSPSPNLQVKEKPDNTSDEDVKEKEENSSSETGASKSTEGDNEDLNEQKRLIFKLFLVEMPKDFYEFFEFCQSIAKADPINALKSVKLQLVGPYDVLSGKIKSSSVDNREKYLRHWRYYYDPPEFQTILKADGKEGLHFGYWRDDCKEKPVFVAKNSASKDYKITAVAEHIFDTVKLYLEEKEKTANIFEKKSFATLQKKLRSFSEQKNIPPGINTDAMKARERKVVARTFHGAGIVVPYDKKTQLGYRDLVASDSKLKSIIKLVDEAETDEEKTKFLSQIQEVARLAIIAADECDFGTCLELGHDLFSYGSPNVEKMALNMLTIAYTHLCRPEFLEIAKAHFNNRKKGDSLSVV